MTKVRFNLDKKDSKEDTFVFLLFRYGAGLRLKYSTGKKINPKFWDEKRQEVKATSKFEFYSEFNQELKDLAAETEKIYNHYIYQNKAFPTLEELRHSLDIYLKRAFPIVIEEAVVIEQITLFGFIEKFIEERSYQPRGTTKLFSTFYNHLKTFAKEKYKGKLDFKDITLDFYYDFTKFLFSEPRKHSSNYAAKMIDILRQIIGDATERGYNHNMAFKSKRFRVQKEPVDSIYLTIEELNKIYEFDFSDNKRLERVRDLFIIGCYTGLRFSDFTVIKPEHIKVINDVDMIIIRTKKTNHDVSIPVHPYIKNILIKYDKKIPKPLSNQKMNDYLKEMAEIIGLDEDIRLIRSVGGKRQEETYKKFELVKTHTCRRSFATNAHKAGLPTIAIMKITGHRTEREFLKYIKISSEENAVLMSKNKFFTI